MCIKGRWAFSLVFLLLLAGCESVGNGPPPNLSASFTTISPQQAEELYRQAENLSRAGKDRRAISLWERIAKEYPSTAVAARSLNRIGEVYLAQGKLQLAARYFNYIIYAYPSWDGVVSAKLNRLRLLARMGKNGEAMKRAVPLWQEAARYPGVRFGLAELMVQIYSSKNDIGTAFKWSSSGFAAAETAKQRESLAALTRQFLSRADEGLVKKLYDQHPSAFMKVFLDYRYARLEAERGQVKKSREMLRNLLAQNPTHPLAPYIEAAIRGATVAAAGTTPLSPDKIGVLAPLNGPNAKYGDMVIRGLNLALSVWKEAHPSQKITLIIRDAGMNPDRTARSYRDLVEKEGVLAIVGPLGAVASKTVAPLADRDGVPVLALTEKNDNAAANPFVLHAFIDSRNLVKTLVRYCRDKLNFKRFACLFPDDRYGRRLSKIFAETVKEQGGMMMASVSYPETATDFAQPLQKLLRIAQKKAPLSVIRGTPFKGLFIPDQVSAVSLIAPQLPYNNVVGVTLLGTNLWSGAPLVQAGGVYMDHALFAAAFFPGNPNPLVKRFDARFQAMYHSTPSYLAAQAYDALTMVLRAKNSAGGADDRSALIRDLTRSGSFEGVAGKYTVDPTGDLSRRYAILQVKNGSVEQVYP